MDTDSSKEGWTWLRNSPKWHYFREGRSLCGKFMLWVDPPDGYKPNDSPESPDNCKACLAKRAKAKET